VFDVRFVFSFRRLALGIGLLTMTSGAGWAQINACDLVAPFGTVDAADVQAAINMTIGISPCTANIGGAGVCNAAVVQRVVNAALGGTCVTGVGAVAHYVSLSWTASTSPNITGYNVYRAATTGGPFTKLTSSLVAAASYVDSTVIAGQTYYYVTTAVDNTGAESAYSGQAQAVIPTP
jgi:hypothetical protein